MCGVSQALFTIVLRETESGENQGLHFVCGDNETGTQGTLINVILPNSFGCFRTTSLILLDSGCNFTAYSGE